MGRSYVGLAALVAGLSLVAPPRAAGQREGEGGGGINTSPTPNREGEYGGVTPGVTQPYDGKDRRAHHFRKRKNGFYWVGFQPREGGGARVFVQLANELPYTQEVVGNVLVVHLEGARFSAPNSRRRLDARFFDTPLLQIKPRWVGRRRARKDRPARKPGIELRISFKDKGAATTAQAAMRQEKDGFTYLYLDFPPGSRQ